MINKKFFQALDDLEREKKIRKEVVLEALESALTSAYKKNFGEGRSIDVRLDPERAAMRVIAYKTVVERKPVPEPPPEGAETAAGTEPAEGAEPAEGTEPAEGAEAAEDTFDPDKEISLEDARAIKKSYKVGDIVGEEIKPADFGRVAAQTAKQVVMQRLREAEGELAYAEISKKEDQLVMGVIRRVDGNTVYVDIGKLEAVLMPQDQCANEKYNVNESIKVYVKKVRQGLRGPQINVSRSTPNFVKRLFEMEVPEIAGGVVTIKNIVREAGFRTKIAVASEDSSVDPVGACVGNRGIRVNTIVSELGGEKIDVIPWCADSLEFIARSLSPAKVIMVEVNDEEHTAKVIVPDDKLSLAIGKSGQNARLAARLTGWKIDVKSYSASLEQAAEPKPVETEVVSVDLGSDIFQDIDLSDF
ncbi:MAG: transcription termination factor NusA [Clostridiales bacterium]|jgi:N utilization substance protein A|nr:transcription termination factor NusA [Clostridiales bacterium]